MISQAIADRSVVTEIYLRLTLATVYHNCGKDEEAVRHIDRAIDLALPDRFHGLLAEYRRVLDRLYVSRLERHGREVAEAVDTLYKQYSRGWTTLGGVVRQRYIANDLTVREREVAKLAAFGLSNAEIASALYLSVASVKETIRAALNKGGVESRAELASIL
jgi:DNA-binding NarL/FixJ family response regulator